MFKASELVAFAKSMIGMPYWYGCVVYPCTESRLQSKAKQYPSHYGSSRMSKYRKAIAAGHVCMDCVGMIKGFFWTNGGQGVLEYVKTGKEYVNKYQSNGCPDKSANGMLDWCKEQGCRWGTIDTLPDIPGIPVYSPGHVGLYIGNGEVVEARGFSHGVVKTKLAGRPWKHWAMLPDFLIQYDGVEIETTPETEVKSEVTPPVEYKLGDRTLRRVTPMMEGKDVEELQANLIKLGFGCGDHNIDGKFGNDTKMAVRNFQRKYGLTVDGEYGPASHKAMLVALTSVDNAPVKNTVIITGSSVNIRKGPGTSYGVLKTSRKGDKFERVDTSDWACVEYGDTVCWVFDDYVIDGVCTASSLNVRKGPSTNYGAVDVVKKGYKFTSVDTENWIPILINGVIYWVSAKYAE